MNAPKPLTKRAYRAILEPVEQFSAQHSQRIETLCDELDVLIALYETNTDDATIQRQRDTVRAAALAI